MPWRGAQAPDEAAIAAYQQQVRPLHKHDVNDAIYVY